LKNELTTAKEILEKYVDFDLKNNNDLIKLDCYINAMEEYAIIKCGEFAANLEIQTKYDTHRRGGF